MIPCRMAGEEGMRLVHASLARAQRVAIRLSHRFRPIEPFDGSRPGVAITGAAGTIGQVLRRDLAGDYSLRTIDQQPAEGIHLAVDVRRPEQLERALEGAAAVVELAASSSLRTSWECVLENNLAATVATLEAARRAGVPRVVVASSNHVSGMHERDEPYASVLAGRHEGLDPDAIPRIRADWAPRPDSF
jgi:hypothetical protein